MIKLSTETGEKEMRSYGLILVMQRVLRKQRTSISSRYTIASIVIAIRALQMLNDSVTTLNPTA
jgi:hypothetical protein